MFWALCADTHRGGVQPLCSSAPEPGVEPLPLPEQPSSKSPALLSFQCLDDLREGGAIADAVPLPRSRRGGKWRDIRFPRRCGGSGARSEPIGALLFSLLPFQCLDDLREGGAIAAEDAFNEAAFGAVFAERRHRDRELQRIVNLHIEERLVKRTGRIRCRF